MVKNGKIDPCTYRKRKTHMWVVNQRYYSLFGLLRSGTYNFYPLMYMYLILKLDHSEANLINCINTRLNLNPRCMKHVKPHMWVGKSNTLFWLDSQWIRSKTGSSWRWCNQLFNTRVILYPRDRKHVKQYFFMFGLSIYLI